MTRSSFLVAALLALPTLAATAGDLSETRFQPDDWPWWRGPHRNGIAVSENKEPLEWSETENVVWKAAVPGRGHGSATVVGKQVFLATAESDRQVQSVLCLDRESGKRLWQATVHEGKKFETKGNGKTTLASGSVACDGPRLFINFLSDGAIWTTALDRDGKQLWQTRLGEYLIHQGYGSSPAIYGDLVIVSADSKGDGMVAAMNRESGKIVWTQPRPKMPNYTSPIILKAAGKEQLFMTGCELVTSLDPATGKKLWEVAGSTTECVTSTVTDGEHIFTSGGYPKNHMSAVKADGSGKVVWENTSRVYVPSMLVKDGHLYSVLDAGVAVCWKCDTGAELWKHRLGGTFSSSPVLAGDFIFATNEAGKTYVFKASSEGYEQVGENQLGTDVFATPTICGGRIYARVAHMKDGQREETLYCLGK